MSITAASRLPFTALFGALLTWAVTGCGGSGPPRGNDNSGSNQNQNLNANDNGGGNDNGTAGLAVTILSASIGPFEVGGTAGFTAAVEDATGSPAFIWSVDDSAVASLAGETTANVTVEFLSSGTVGLAVQVTNPDTGETATDEIELTVSGDITPPPGAGIQVIDLCTQPGVLVGLVAQVSGPAPQTLSWEPDAANIIQPFDFTDLGNGVASFTAPVQFMFVYDLNFIFTATYENGATLSDVATVTVMGNNAACF